MNEPKPIGVFALQYGSYNTYAEAKENGADYEIAQGCFSFEGTTGGHNLDMIVALDDMLAAINVADDWETIVVFEDGTVRDAHTYFNQGYTSREGLLEDALNSTLRIIHQLNSGVQPKIDLAYFQRLLAHK